MCLRVSERVSVCLCPSVSVCLLVCLCVCLFVFCVCKLCKTESNGSVAVYLLFLCFSCLKALCSFFPDELSHAMRTERVQLLGQPLKETALHRP